MHASYTGRVANCQSLVLSQRNQRPLHDSIWNEGHTNEHQSRDFNRNATNAGSTRTNQSLCPGRRYGHQRTPVIWVAAITLASTCESMFACVSASLCLSVSLSLSLLWESLSPLSVSPVCASPVYA